MKLFTYPKSCLIALLLLTFLHHAQAQTSVSGIVNTYYPVSAVAGTTVTVGTSTGATHTLAAGDWVMLIQMTGDPAIRAGSNMGKYEVAQVSSVAGSDVTLSALTRSYTTTEKVQLVWIPFSATGFNVTGTVTPLAWNGTTGGIVALKGSTLTLNSNIDATASGFTPLLKPGGSVLPGAGLGEGTTVGRGFPGAVIFGSGPNPQGGGGETGGGILGGGNPGQGGSTDGVISPGVNGGFATINTQFGGALASGGGGGGIFGGGGGGGTSAANGVGFAGGGGGVAGGGNVSEKTGGVAPTGPAGGGGGSGGVGNGADGIGGGTQAFSNPGGTEGSAGAGGGSYGGGGGAPNNHSGGDDGCGGGGGGSYTGGGFGGFGGGSYPVGGNGNLAVATIPDAAHFLKSTDPRLMMGGAGGRGSAVGTFPAYVNGGNGGGIVFLDFASMAGPGDVISNGGAGANAPTGNARSGGGGGGGGQMALKVGTFTSTVDISAAGGAGGDPGADSYHGGSGGAGGGGGGIWIQTNDATTRTVGATESLANVTVNLAGGNAGSQIINPKNNTFTSQGGAGGVGLSVVEQLPCTNPIATASATQPNCSIANAPNNGGITIAGFTTGQRYQYSPGTTFNSGSAVPASITTIPTGGVITSTLANTTQSYTVRIYDAADNTCFVDRVVSITAIAACCAAPSPTGTGATICAGNTAILTASGCDATYPAIWYSDSGLSTQVGTGNSFTTPTLSTTTNFYVACVKDASCKSTGVIVTATVTAVAASYPICPGESYTFTAQAGLSNYQWYTITGTDTTIISGANSQTYTATTVGKYIWKATNATTSCPIKLCCPINIVAGACCVPPAPIGTGATICAGNTATLTVTGCDATHPAIWYSEAALTTQVGTGNSFTTPVLSTTTNYYVSCVKDATCKSTGVMVTATVNPKPTMSGGTVCVGGTTTLTGSGTPAASNPYTSSNTAIATVTSGGVVTGVAAGTATITYTNSAGCTVTANVTVNPQPTMTGGTVCVGGTTTLTGSGTPAASNPYNSSNTAIATVTSGGVVTGVAAGTATITYTNSAGCTVTANVTVNPQPTMTGGSVCVGSTITLTGSGTPAASSPYTSSNTAIATVTSGGVVTGVAAGTATITYTNSAGCTVTANVTVNPSPTMTGGSVCVGSTITLTGSGTPAASTPYTSSNTAIATVTSGGVVTGVAAGTATITYTNSAGCTVTATVTVNPLPTLTLTTAVCSPNLLTYTITFVSNGTVTSTAGTVDNVAKTVSGITAGTNVTLTSTLNNCITTLAVTAPDCNCPTVQPPTSSGDKAVCQGLPLPSLTVTVGTGESANWYDASNTLVASNTLSYTPTVAGNYFVEAYNTATLCKSTTKTPVKLTINPSPTMTGGSVCVGSTITLTGSGTPAASTPYTSSNTAIATVTNGGVVTGVAAGTATITYTDNNGCTVTATVTVNSKPNAGNNQTVCAGTTATLVGTSPATGTWTAQGSNPAGATLSSTTAGAATATFSTTAVGDYNFIYTVGSCSDTVKVTVNAKVNAGSDVTLTCPPSGIAPTTASLAPVTAGGTWVAQAGNPVTTTITGNNVSEMTASGTYKFIYSVTTRGVTCTDTAQIIVPTCVQPKGSLGDFVWKDTNNNGIQDETTPNGGGVAGVQVELYKVGTTAAIAKDTTDATGKYLFTNLDAGTYYIKVLTASIPAGCEISSVKDAPSDDAKDSDVDKTTGQSGNYVIDPTDPTKKDILTVDAALFSPKGSLGDFVWKDTNNNGIQDETTPNGGGVAGVQVELYKVGTTAAIAKDTTDATGKYLFTNLDAGTYYIKVLTASIPAGCEISSVKDAPSDDAKDSDVDKTTGQSGNYVIDPTDPTKKDILTVDAALYSPKGSLGDFVWKDTNNNGIQDETTPNGGGVAGVQVELYKVGTTAAIAKDTSDATGKYLFTNLDAGTYYIKVLTASLPVGCEISSVKDAPSDDAKDSDVDKTTGQSGNYVIDPTDPTKKDILTVDAALFSPKGSLGDFVWKDTNNNGIQDETTPNGGGVAGVQVELYKVGTTAAIAKDTTDATGKYLFTNLDAGTYYIKVLTASIPAGCEISSVKDAPSDDAKDSDVDKATGQSGNYVIDPTDPTKKDILTVDAALYSPKGSLGDFVWKDTNNNGIQDETTPNGGGVAGVQVELYKVGTTAAIAKDTTDATGKYLFTNLDAGTYYIKVLKASIPAGCEISSVKDAPSDDAKDSDVDKATGQSGNYVIDPTDPTKKDILTVDAALAVPCVKSKVTLTGAAVCSADVQTYSITFSVTNKVGTLKVNKGTLTGANPYTVTGIPSGATIKITDSLSVICKFDTLITGPNCNCNPRLPTLLTPSMTACAGDTFPTLKAMVVGLATVEWFTQATGGTAVFTGVNYKPSGAIPTTGAVFYAQARSTDPTCPTAISTSRVMATINAQDCTKEVDLALKKSINTKIAKIGDVLTYTLKVWNESNTNATGVEVTDSIATTVQFVTGSFAASRGSANIAGNVIKWVIGNIAANGDTVTLTYRVKATQEGVHFNTAEISKVNEKDNDSTPDNGKDNEDDIDRQCFTVPIKLCTGSKVEASVSAKYTNVQWFKDGDSTPIASGNVVLLSGVGIYTYTATNQTCPAGGCCPIIIENNTNCCPIEKCVPLTIKKIKK